MAALIVMAYALAELRHGVVARQHENGFKCGHNFAQTLYMSPRVLRALYVAPYSRTGRVWKYHLLRKRSEERRSFFTF